MQGEEPVLGRDWPAGHGDPTVAGGRGAPGVGAHVVPGRQSWEKRLLAACGVMDALPHQALAGAGGVGLVSPGTRHRQLRVCEDRSPPRRLVLAAAPDARPVAHPGAEPWPQGTPRPPWRGRARVPQGVERGAEGLAHGGRQRGQWPRALDARGAEAMAEMRPRLARAHPLGGLSKPSGTMPRPRSAGSSKRAARERLRGLGQGGRTGLLGRAQRPAHPAADNCRRYTVSVRPRRGFSAARKRGRGRLHRVRTDTRRGCPSAPTRRESAIGALEPSTAHRSKRRPPWVAKRGVASHVGAPRAIAYDAEHGLARRTRDPPEVRSPGRTRVSCAWRVRHPPP